MGVQDSFSRIPGKSVTRRCTRVTDLNSVDQRKSVVVLDETKQLQCGYVTVGCRRVRSTDVIDRIYIPQCTTSREDRQVVRISVTDHSVTSRAVAQHIESVTHHSVSARTIRRRLQKSGLSARRPLPGLPLTQNHRCLHSQWCDERSMWAAEGN
ncbi:transposable element Tcb1 transposase [Trichonephila clavipes]|nr:transposable element Tcb1 transposase [Trichonephila clavipes]